VTMEADAAVVVMNHSYPRDSAVLAALSQRPVRYLGVLGPRQRTGRLLEELGVASRPWNVFAPIGLDLGAQTPESIALAIVAEIEVVLNGAGCGSMRDQPGPIHRVGHALVPSNSPTDRNDPARPPLQAQSPECQTRPTN
jgi:xanthine dehydrogenase accessory factor